MIYKSLHVYIHIRYLYIHAHKQLHTYTYIYIHIIERSKEVEKILSNEAEKKPMEAAAVAV